jgi:uncharacterized membrane protein
VPRHASVILFLGSALWLAAIVSAPFGLEFPYLLGSAICHQRPERSFSLAGRPCPVCARCTGLYAAAVIGAAPGVFVSRARFRRSRLRAATVRVLLLAAAVPTAATLVIEWTGLAEPSSLARAVAALPLGAAAGWIVVVVLREAEVD